MFTIPELFHKSPATNPPEEVGKLTILTVPLSIVLIIDVLPIVTVLEPAPIA